MKCISKVFPTLQFARRIAVKKNGLADPSERDAAGCITKMLAAACLVAGRGTCM